jgi:tRNA nucleotidyltransferase (CCA-adding enzyme)
VTPAAAGSPLSAASGPTNEAPRSELPIDPNHLAVDIGARVTPQARSVLERLWSAGFEAYVVGGSLRDLLLEREVADWDVATSALPGQTQELFPESVYENRFGTVAVRLDGSVFQVTTFRGEHHYADHRRPERVEFGVTIDEDLARRDFAMNAIAWGGHGNGGRGGAGGGGQAGAQIQTRIHDPFDGMADLRNGLIRAVGRPDDRFAEDALRMLRAVRFAATLGFAIEPETLAAIRRHADLVAGLSGERVQAELRRILAAPRPSIALELAAETGSLAVRFPDLAAQRGIAQNKIPGQDLWQHTLATVDAADVTRPIVRLAALLHDIGKPATLQEGHFPGHDTEGARVAEKILRELAFPRQEIDRVVLLVAQHMFNYSPAWSDAAVRRFMRRVGVDAIDDLLALREADNAGSGQPGDEGGLAELRRRIAGEIAAGHALRLADLAIDGNDLRAALAIPPGPEVGRVLRALLEQVVGEPSLNERERLIEAARRIHSRGTGR